MDRKLGPSDNLDDFCKKAQLINYESHRAIFEAWNSKMWNDASGVLLWMSHPAWQYGLAELQFKWRNCRCLLWHSKGVPSSSYSDES